MHWFHSINRSVVGEEEIEIRCNLKMTSCSEGGECSHYCDNV